MLGTLTFDGGVHIAEVVAIIFWIGVSWGDIKWIKSELKYLRDRFDGYVGREEKRP
jgi:hypothetical protein